MRRILPFGSAWFFLVLALLPGGSVAARERWLAVRSTYFTVLTTDTEKSARNWATELERFRLMLQPYVPAPEERLRPVTVVLFASDRALRPYKPLEKGRPQQVEGIFVNFGDSHAIGLSRDGDPARTRRVIFHEAVHWYSNASDLVLPLWLEEGIAEVYSTFRVSDQGTCAFGHPIPEHLRMLQLLPGWSMGSLAATTHDSLAYNEGARATQFYAGAWLAAHYLLFGRDTPGRASIGRYVAALAKEKDPARAFQDAFGMDFPAFTQQLQAYRQGGHYTVRTFPVPPDEIERRLAVQPATEAEVELALGTLLLGTRQAVSTETDRHLLRAAALAPHNPVVWQVLGEGAMLGRRYDDAQEYFTRAVAAGSTSYFAYHCLGFCRMRGLEVTHGFSDTVSARRSLQDFRQALAMNPRFVPAYEAMAGLMFADAAYEPRDRELLERGARLAPASALIEVGLAACDLKQGRRPDGRRRLERVAQSTPPDSKPEARDLAARILHGDDWNECAEELAGLFAHQRYAEAVALIDAVRERFPEPNFRTSLTQSRRRAAESARLHEAVELANSGAMAAARQRLAEILDADVEPLTKVRAQRLLDEIARNSVRLPSFR